MTNQNEIIEEREESYATPHIFISETLKMPAKAIKEKISEKLADVFNLENTEIDVLLSAAADLSQLKKAIENPFKFNLGLHAYTYIEFDVVTWRIFPSPENVRFEDQRFGVEDASRFGSLDLRSPVLSFEAESVNRLIDSTENESRDIMQENPHTKTIANRGIEVGGWLSFARLSASDLTRPIGILESTDGFSRTVGAHAGLGLSPRDALLRMSNPDAELEYRKSLIDLRDKSVSGENIGPVSETKLRCSVMRRARVIVGYEYFSSGVNQPKFDKARRTLVGHLHLAPQFGFSQSANAVTKASEICSALENNGFIPTVDGMSYDEVVSSLSGNLTPWIQAGYTIDQYAPFILSAYRPNLLTKQGKAIRQAIENLTGQSIKSDELAEIAAEVAVRAILKQRNLQRAESDQLVAGLRSVLGKTWQSSIFAGVVFTNRELDELYEASLSELEFEVANPGKTQASVSGARSELAAMASLLMVAVTNPPLLVRAVGRKGFGNNDEPSKVVGELIRIRAGLAQLKQIVQSVRVGKDPKVVIQDDSNPNEYLVETALADPAAIKQLYLEPQNDPQAYEKSSVEILNDSLYALAHRILLLDDLVSDISQIKSEQGVSLISQDGVALEQELANLAKVQQKLSHWNYIAQEKLEARRELDSDN